MSNILEILQIISSVQNVIAFMRANSLLKNSLVCCGQNASIVGDIKNTDQEIFQCNICNKRLSIRIGSFYFNSKVSLIVHLCILYFFSNGSTVSDCKKF